MAAPSSLPSAKAVAEQCFDKWQLESDPLCDVNLRESLEALAEYFADLGELKSVFIQHLVPWKDFIRPTNAGHAAVADFLITRAAAAGISSNCDILIEMSAWSYGSDFLSALDGDEAIAAAVHRGPLLKLHGCSNRDRPSTVWAPSQLNDPIIADRIRKSKTWMAANLRQKDLLVVGFWSDWEYLNGVVGSALKDVDPLSVTVIDPSPAKDLQQKAPELWDIAHAKNVTFFHVRDSGAAALDELRQAFSSNYIRQVLAAGCTAFEQRAGVVCNPTFLDVSAFDSETLYGWRRDAEGVQATKPATRLQPVNPEALGFFHLALRQAGATPQAGGYDLSGRTIRVINGAGTVLSSLRSKFIEPPSVTSADIVVAVGATDLGVPANVVRSGRVNDVVRPDAGGTWFDLNSALEELKI